MSAWQKRHAVTREGESGGGGGGTRRFSGSSRVRIRWLVARMQSRARVTRACAISPQRWSPTAPVKPMAEGTEGAGGASPLLHGRSILRDVSSLSALRMPSAGALQSGAVDAAAAPAALQCTPRMPGGGQGGADRTSRQLGSPSISSDTSMPTMPRVAVGREAAAGEIAALGKRDGRLAAVGRAREGGTEQLASGGGRKLASFEVNV